MISLEEKETLIGRSSCSNAIKHRKWAFPSCFFSHFHGSLVHELHDWTWIKTMCVQTPQNQKDFSFTTVDIVGGPHKKAFFRNHVFFCLKFKVTSIWKFCGNGGWGVRPGWGVLARGWGSCTMMTTTTTTCTWLHKAIPAYSRAQPEKQCCCSNTNCAHLLTSCRWSKARHNATKDSSFLTHSWFYPVVQTFLRTRKHT